MNLQELNLLANGPTIQLINWLQARNLLSARLRCAPCQQGMVLARRDADHVDGYQWRCTACRRKKSLRTGSFFNEFPRTSMGKILSAIYLWSMHELRATAARMLDMTKNAIGNVYALLRHYCGEDLRDRPIIPIDGRTFVVKCDESKFNHKPKYQRGRRARNQQWVFGVISTAYTPCRGYFQVVQRRDRATLGPILDRVLLPGSEVHTDDWGAYRDLERHVPNVHVHQAVIHVDNFVDPVTGINTQEVESAWNRLKYVIRREKGIRGGDLQGFLDEQMWRDWRGLGNDFDNILEIISTYYYRL